LVIGRRTGDGYLRTKSHTFVTDDTSISAST